MCKTAALATNSMFTKIVLVVAANLTRFFILGFGSVDFAFIVAFSALVGGAAANIVIVLVLVVVVVVMVVVVAVVVVVVVVVVVGWMSLTQMDSDLRRFGSECLRIFDRRR